MAKLALQTVAGSAGGTGRVRPRWDPARRFRLEMLALTMACFAKGTPWSARLAALATFVYIISPIDLIPDTIPVLGQLDDLTIIALAFFNIPRLIPRDVMHGSQIRAAEHLSRAGGWLRTVRRVLTAAIVIVPISAAIVVGVLAAWLLAK